VKIESQISPPDLAELCGLSPLEDLEVPSWTTALTTETLQLPL